MSGPQPTPSAAPAPAPVAGPPPRKRGRETARDMVWSLAVVFLFVGFILLVTYRAKPDAVHVIDPRVPIAQARDQAPFEPMVPTGLPAGWQVTSAGYESPANSSVPNAAHWHIGYVTPEGEYAAVDQATGDPTVLVKAVEDKARQVGAGEGAFAGWQHWLVGDQRQAYVLPAHVSASGAVDPKATSVVIHGTAGDSELTQLLTALRPQPTPDPSP